MNGYELSLQVCRKFGDNQPMRRYCAADFIAIGGAFCGKLQVEEALIPRGDLYTLEAEARGPSTDFV
jgi:hypothetical protein